MASDRSTRGFVVLEQSLVQGGVPFVDAALSVLAARDERWLRQNPRAPRLYDSGVRYVASEERTEWWRTVPEVLSLALLTGGTDCQDLAAWRAAELRARGVDPDARPFAQLFRVERPDGGVEMLFHALVRRGPRFGGRVEDPSARLGMK